MLDFFTWRHVKVPRLVPHLTFIIQAASNTKGRITVLQEQNSSDRKVKYIYAKWNQVIITWQLSTIFQNPTFFSNQIRSPISLQRVGHFGYYGQKSSWKNHVWAYLFKLLRNLRKSIEEERKSRRIMEEKISSWNAWSPRNRANRFKTKIQ